MGNLLPLANEVCEGYVFTRGGIFAPSLCCVFKLCSLFSVLNSVSLF